MNIDKEKTHQRNEKRFDILVQERRVEMDLFWKRSLFFWGFIAAAFTAFTSIRASQPGMAVVVASFGFLCSMSLSLVNRGNKYWQEFWESELQATEILIIDPVYKRHPKGLNKGRWLSGRRYSASKLSIALGDYVTFLWLCAMLYQCIVTVSSDSVGIFELSAIPLFTTGTLIFSFCILFVARTSEPE